MNGVENWDGFNEWLEEFTIDGPNENYRWYRKPRDKKDCFSWIKTIGELYEIYSKLTL